MVSGVILTARCLAMILFHSRPCIQSLIMQLDCQCCLGDLFILDVVASTSKGRLRPRRSVITKPRRRETLSAKFKPDLACLQVACFILRIGPPTWFTPDLNLMIREDWLWEMRKARPEMKKNESPPHLPSPPRLRPSKRLPPSPREMVQSE
ncbi:hypothetical protein B0H16DRAFT_1604484 [Mycena metata]|uniref:Uncharacterized protein n=1 Tax=Mycena metata TaxID=1033252 RepID=A0AAD7HGV9_9AGAR|nr:hypothetical protein B0H16DRAFT_1604484 [Mycena metata]